MSLNHVKAVVKPIQVGSILTKSGAWNRKYKVLAITPVTTEWNSCEYALVEIQYLGNYYASGKTIVPKKLPRSFEVLSMVYDGGPRPDHYIHVEEQS